MVIYVQSQLHLLQQPEYRKTEDARLLLRNDTFSFNEKNVTNYGWMFQKCTSAYKGNYYTNNPYDGTSLFSCYVSQGNSRLWYSLGVPFSKDAIDDLMEEERNQVAALKLVGKSLGAIP
eukprot:scaffold273601_cov50-Prasinocladus_malaysianus.AAC.2